MPNWAFNKVMLVGMKTDVEASINGILNEGDVDFNKIIPMPAHQPDLLEPNPFWAEGDMPFVLNEIFGRNTWYDWSVANWGTKWNARDTSISGNLVEFDTAWAGVSKVILEWSRKFPAVDMGYDVSYEAENVVDHYVIRAGEEISYWEEELEYEEYEEEE